MSRQLVNTQLWAHQLETADRFERMPRVLTGWWMGTGKTLFGIERDLRFRSIYRKHNPDYPFRTLIVAPSAVHRNWLDALVKETDLSVRHMNPKKRELFFENDSDYYLMHWEALIKLVERTGKAKVMNPIKEVKLLGFSHVILDEAHRIKNKDAQRTKAAKHLGIRLATDMTGSPVPNKPQDLWSLLNHLYPKQFNSYWAFVKRYMDIDYSGPYIQIGAPNKHWYEDRTKLLEDFVSIIEDKDLPHLGITKPTYTTLTCTLSGKQRTAYKAMEKDMLAWVEDHLGDESPLAVNAVIAQLIRLQQFAIGYMVQTGTNKEGGPIFKMDLPAAKLELIKEFISDTDETFVIFSQFSQPLELLEKMLPDDVALYTGRNVKTRDANLERFKNGYQKVIAMTYGTGGEGIDGLQHVCRNIIQIDKAWAPSANDQAIGRIRRYGQTKPVNVYLIEAEDTIDEVRNSNVTYKGKINRKMLGLDG
jgi:SNF2 family DNA or RNA helicase